MIPLYYSMMSARLFLSTDLEGLKEGLTETADNGGKIRR